MSDENIEVNVQTASTDARAGSRHSLYRITSPALGDTFFVGNAWDGVRGSQSATIVTVDGPHHMGAEGRIQVGDPAHPNVSRRTETVFVPPIPQEQHRATVGDLAAVLVSNFVQNFQR